MKKYLIKIKLNKLLFLLGLVIFQPFLPNYLNAEIKNEQEPIEDNKKQDQKINLIPHQDDYLLGPGDSLNIKFLGNEGFSGIYKVNLEGAINMPYIGRVYILRNTTEMVEIELEKRYESLLIENEIQVEISYPRPSNISVLGEVEKPASYSFENFNPINSTISQVRLLEVIKKAGGVTRIADIENIEVIRKMSKPNNSLKRAKIDLLEFAMKGIQDNNIYMFDGDVVKVNRISSNTSRNASKFNNFLFSDVVNVIVVGEVNLPGNFKLPKDSTLLEAIMYAGGFNEVNAKRKVDLIRKTEDGKFKLNRYRIDLAKGINSIQNPRIIEGDIIKINKTKFGTATTALKQIAEPTRDVINIYGLYKILNDD